MKLELTEYGRVWSYVATDDRVWSYVATDDIHSAITIEFLSDNALAIMGYLLFSNRFTGFGKDVRIFVHQVTSQYKTAYLFFYQKLKFGYMYVYVYVFDL